ncbi:hypothetical protein CTZ23_09130 [Acinetobacter indicus]|nr:hypothetical protein CTZ23_09130 [Acinetobacter indicus]
MILNNAMKKLWMGILLWGSLSVVQAASVEQYVLAVEQINQSYKQQTRQFLKGLNPQQSGFSPAQQQQFCGIVQNYIDQLYSAADENRAYLDPQYRNMTKQDVAQQVYSSKEMQMLKKYQVNCAN